MKAALGVLILSLSLVTLASARRLSKLNEVEETGFLKKSLQKLSQNSPKLLPEIPLKTLPKKSLKELPKIPLKELPKIHQEAVPQIPLEGKTGDSLKEGVTTPLIKEMSPQAWDEVKNKVVEDFTQWIQKDLAGKQQNPENTEVRSQGTNDDKEQEDDGWVSWMKTKLSCLVPDSVKKVKENVEDWIKQSPIGTDVAVEDQINSFFDNFFGYIDTLLSYAAPDETSQVPQNFQPWLVNGTLSREKQRLWYDYLYKKWKHYFKKSHRMPYN